MKCLESYRDFFEGSAGFRLFGERKFKLALEVLENEIQRDADRRMREYARFYAAQCHFVLGNYPAARRYLLQTNKWAGRAEERPMRMACVFNLAVVEVACGNREKGLGIYDKFRTLYENRLLPYDRCMLLLNLGLTHTQLKQYGDAQLCLDQARVLADELEDAHLLTYTLYYTGILANRQGDMNRSREFSELAVATAEASGCSYDICRSHWQLGNQHLRAGKYDMALKSLKKSIRIAKQAGYQVETAKCLNDFAWAYFKTGKLAEAKSYAEEAIITGRDAGMDADSARFLDTLEQISAHINDFYEEEKLIAELERESARDFEIVGYSEAISIVTQAIRTFGPCNDPILILGETGTGKELVTRALFDASPRHKGMFFKRNCAAIPENLIESELFGHVKGAFTGATSDRKGIFEQADGGVLFLDEIGEMPLNLQSKLLRVLEYGEFYRLGSTDLIKVDVRIFAATNKDLADEVRAGNFREDLYYRLNTIRIDLPPLRERREDIAVLVNHFLFALNEEYDKYYKVLTTDALQTLESYNFAGNIRELKNIIRAAYLTSKGRQITAEDVQRYFQKPSRRQVAQTQTAAPVLDLELDEEDDTTASHAPARDEKNVVPFENRELVDQTSLKEHVLSAERDYLLKILKQCDSVNKACSVLKISRPTFYQKLKSHGISLSNKRLV
ncbi:MAG: sigma 54-interacting transcriptional regulator [Candidatus Cloacimonetes bacterium]|nr:sigma 54-interacting transcriptional regulator [Candidatus Cloacimonadota bacterium]